MRVDLDRAIEGLVRGAGERGSAVHAVWVFGSCARGEAGPESDIDLAILCDPPLGLDVTALIDRLGRALAVEVDVIDLATTSATLA
jgi:predicted nucleotidyltransferase